MKNNVDKTSEGLNQIFEIINVKGDLEELKEIVELSEVNEKQNKNFKE